MKRNLLKNIKEKYYKLLKKVEKAQNNKFPEVYYIFKRNDIVKFPEPGKYILGDFYKIHIYKDLFNVGIDPNKIYCVGITHGTRFAVFERDYDNKGVYYLIRKLGNNTYELFVRQDQIEETYLNDIDFCDEDPEILNNLQLINKRNEIGYINR